MVGAEQLPPSAGAIVATIIPEASWHPTVPLGICALALVRGDTAAILLQSPWVRQWGAGGEEEKELCHR